MGLQCELQVGNTPYGDVLPQSEFERLMKLLVEYTANVIEGIHSPSDSFGLCILDPTAPKWKATSACILLTAAIGEKGRKCVPNAMSKAFGTRDSGEEWGKVLYTQPHRIPGGSFRWGYAAVIDDTIVGGSALSERDDQKVCTQVGVMYNGFIAEAFRRWEMDAPRTMPDGTNHSWFTDSGSPPGWLAEHPMANFDGPGVLRLND